ncbi:hypothetical protein SL034_001617 [Vibrio harveyi]|nr:hypothetical protein [Vibrio harveyi]
MSYDEQVKNIRNKLKTFTTESLIEITLQRLHANHEGPVAMERAWVSCLLLEWILEVNPHANAKSAEPKDVHELLNKIWALQGEATILSTSSESLMLALRPFLLTQLRFQQPQIIHAYFLVRLYSIMVSVNNSPQFEQSFKKLTGIELERFYSLSLLMLQLFANVKSVYLPYKDLLTNFHPSYSIDEITLVLKSLGANWEELRTYFKDRRERLGPLKKSEYCAETQLTKFPLLLTPSSCTTTHTYVASIGISEFVLRILKEDNPSTFRNKFSRAFESYMANTFNDFSIPVVPESSIEQHYEKHNTDGKVVDFLLNVDGKSVLFDAKGVEPKDVLLTTDSSKTVKEKLRDTLLKGVEQAAECSQLLSQTQYPDFADYSDRYALVVSHKEFYFGGGAQLAEYLGEFSEDKIHKVVENKIPIENIHFCSIAELEGMIAICVEVSTSIPNFLEYCTQQNKTAATAKFEMRQHLESFIALKGLDHGVPIGSQIVYSDYEKLMDRAHEAMTESKRYWRDGGMAKASEFLHKLELLQKQISS